MQTFCHTFMSHAKHAFLLLAVWLIATVAGAQEGAFTLSYNVTAGTCVANPTIRVDIKNSTFEAGTEYQYTLYKYPITADGKPISTTDDSYTFTNLTAGTYRVEVMVRGFTDYTKTIDNIVVPVVYQPIKIGTDQVNSRNQSYACGTGRMEFIITGGNGTYTMSIAEGPMRVGETIGYERIAGTDRYRLEGENWKPGTYTLHVKDECGNVESYEFTIQPISSLPDLNTLKQFSNAACNLLKVITYPTSWEASSPYYKELLGGVYEVGVKMPWMSDSDIAWHTLAYRQSDTSSIVTPVDYYTLAGQYTNRTIAYQVLIRVKACPEIQSSVSNSIRFSPYVYLRADYNPSLCSGRKVIGALLEESHAFCPPLTFKAYWQHDGIEELIGTETKTTREYGTVFLATMPSDFFSSGSTKVKVEVTDAAGHTDTDYATIRLITSYQYYDIQDDCGYSKYEVTLRNSYGVKSPSQDWTTNFTCNVIGKVYNSAGEVVREFKVNSYDVSFGNFNYDETYTVVYHYEAYPEKEYTTNIYRSRPASSFINSLDVGVDFDAHRINYGKISVQVYGGYGKGSTITLTGPDGRSWSQTFTTSSRATNYIYFFKNYLPLPVGEYTIDLYNTCTNKHTIKKYIYKGGYTVEDFTYTLEYLCGEAYLKPSAVVRREGTKLSSSQYYFFVKQKQNFVEEKVASPGQTIKLSAEGEYQLGVGVIGASYAAININFNNPDSIDYRLADITVTYKTPSLTIDPDRSFSYACGANVDGQIYLQAMGGVPPYTYKLYTDSTLQHPAMKNSAALTYTGSDYAHFEFGRVGDVVYAQIMDKCGASYKQAVPIIDVTQVSAVYANPDSVCEGTPVRLRFRAPETLKSQILARWYNPQGELLSNTNNSEVVLTNTTASMSGKYRVVFTLPGCGTEVTNEINIKIGEPLSSGTLPQDQYNVCVGEPVTVQGLVTAVPDVKYQWEIADQQSVDVLGQLLGDPDAYIYKWMGNRLLDNPRTKDYNTRFVASGTYVLRQIMSKDGCSTESSPVFVKVRACTVPVNPHLMHRPVVNWNRFNHIPTKMAP